jgi:ABC-type lipoprotein export system ATPase subunit
MNDTPENRPILRAQALRKSYLMGGRNLEVLAGIDLAVARGEFIALRGASGAGKSTLLHLLGGLDLPNAGEILFDGKNLVSLSPNALAQWRNRRVGFVF